MSKPNVRLEPLPNHTTKSSFEYMDTLLSVHSTRIRVLVMYRPSHDEKKRKIPVSLFYEEFSRFIDDISI